MAGRKPKPTAIKKLEGNPGKSKLNTRRISSAHGHQTLPDIIPQDKRLWNWSDNGTCMMK